VITDLLLAIAPSSLKELRDRGLLAYHMNDFAAALRDLEEYLKLVRLTEMDEDQRKENEQVWEHVKALRRRVASLN
jgi:regulator of sirC expression with transglutaminase-like and TPR domain